MGKGHSRGGHQGAVRLTLTAQPHCEHFRGEIVVKLPRRHFLHLLSGAAALPVVSRVAWAQAYPARPVRIIVGFAPAGGTDIMARLIGQWLSERLGQQFVIENRPGAGSNIATDVVVNAPPFVEDLQGRMSPGVHPEEHGGLLLVQCRQTRLVRGC